MRDRADELIDVLGLKSHPEGGHYCEEYRSAEVVRRESDGARRCASTQIYFLLRAGQMSRWHRVVSSESWHFVEGSALSLMDVELETGRTRRVELGPLQSGHAPVHIIEAGHWQAARSQGEYTLVVCQVAPGFEFEDFRMLALGDPEIERLRALAPDWPAQ